MESISIKPTGHSPLINFNTDGNLLLEGRSIPEDVNKLFSPLIDFAIKIAVPQVNFDVNLEYFNTATSKVLLDLFRYLDANNKVANILINWHYEDGDEDSLEMAEIYEESLRRTKFTYIMHNDVVSLAKDKEVNLME